MIYMMAKELAKELQEIIDDAKLLGVLIMVKDKIYVRDHQGTYEVKVYD